MTRHIKSRDSGFSRKYVMYKANYAQFSFRVRICDPRIAICGSNVFLRITLSSFCEICESKLSFCRNFCLQGNQVSVYTSSSTNRLYIAPKSVKLYTIFLHVDSILAQNPQWETYIARPYTLIVGTSP